MSANGNNGGSVKCPECGKIYSANMQSCPRCGAARLRGNRHAVRDSQRVPVIMGVIVFAFLTVATGVLLKYYSSAASAINKPTPSATAIKPPDMGTNDTLENETPVVSDSPLIPDTDPTLPPMIDKVEIRINNKPKEDVANNVGTKTEVTAYIRPQDFPDDPVWTSSDESVASVVPDANDPYKATIHATAVGNTTISLTCGGITYKMIFRVRKK